MAEIRAFQGIRYNQSLAKDLSRVISPPYDIISPEFQRELYRRSEYNFVRLEHCLEMPQDTASDNKFTRAAETLKRWLKEGVLKPETVPTIYLHDQHFIHQRKRYRRRGITTLVKLEEWDKGVVRPHEGTLSGPKSERLNLLWALNADTSPILTLFEDEGKKIGSLLETQEEKEPEVAISGADGESHRIWAITDAGVMNNIVTPLASKPLYIADGHHRYESALAYRQEKGASSTPEQTGKPFDFVMMTLVDFDDPGLLILPPHRLLKGISKSALGELRAKLETFFEIEEVPLSHGDVSKQIDGLLDDDFEEREEVRLVLFGLPEEQGEQANKLLLLRLINFAKIAPMMPYFHSELYQKLDVSIVDHVILGKLLGLESGGEAETLNYSYDKAEAIKQVLEQEYQLAFLLSPVKPKVIKAVADVGDRMPKKSTYFYPKLPAGLVFYHWG